MNKLYLMICTQVVIYLFKHIFVSCSHWVEYYINLPHWVTNELSQLSQFLKESHGEPGEVKGDFFHNKPGNHFLWKCNFPTKGPIFLLWKLKFSYESVYFHTNVYIFIRKCVFFYESTYFPTKVHIFLWKLKYYTNVHIFLWKFSFHIQNDQIQTLSDFNKVFHTSAILDT